MLWIAQDLILLTRLANYVKSKENIVNPLTKSLLRELVYNLRGE
jgi:hypothetical protein